MSPWDTVPNNCLHTMCPFPYYTLSVKLNFPPIMCTYPLYTMPDKSWWLSTYCAPKPSYTMPRFVLMTFSPFHRPCFHTLLIFTHHTQSRIMFLCPTYILRMAPLTYLHCPITLLQPNLLKWILHHSNCKHACHNSSVADLSYGDCGESRNW